MRKIIHVELVGRDEHYYFGSKAAVWTRLSAEELGISKNYLKNMKLTEGGYRNGKCVIRQGELITMGREKED